MSKYNIKLSLQGFEPPTLEKDIPVPEAFMGLLESLNLTRFQGEVEFSNQTDYLRFQAAISKTIDSAKKKIAIVITNKTNVKIRPERLKISVISVNEIVQQDTFEDVPF